MCGFGVQTQNHLEANRSIYPVGCADKAVMWMESHLLLVGALALGLALPQVRPRPGSRDISNPERRRRGHEKSRKPGSFKLFLLAQPDIAARENSDVSGSDVCSSGLRNKRRSSTAAEAPPPPLRQARLRRTNCKLAIRSRVLLPVMSSGRSLTGQLASWFWGES